jgi:hypothetical protein
MNFLVVLTSIHFADPTPNPSPTLPRELDPNVVSPGLTGLAFFLFLVIALFFLMRSFVKNLRRIDLPASDLTAPPVSGGRADQTGVATDS